MATYKVPQDVEADDKLIGPFSFRQFIYLIVAAISIGLAWGLAQLFIGLALIPLPIILFFGALALPLRKDQPMEIYLAAVVSFHLKPRKRLWQPDGIQSLVEITAPRTKEVQRTKDLSQEEAEQRLSYLAGIVDSEGWAVRGIGVPTPNSAMQNDVYFDAKHTEDVLDETGGVAQSFDTMIDQTDARRKQELIERMKQGPAATAAPSVFDPYASVGTPTATTPQAPADDPHLTLNPYPNSMHQSVINPLGGQPAPQPQEEHPKIGPAKASVPTAAPTLPPPAHLPAFKPVDPATDDQKPVETAKNTSEKVVSPDIINLANNSDLSIETIAHEANRIHEKEHDLPEEEVVISLR